MGVKCLKYQCNLFPFVKYVIRAGQNIWKWSIGLSQNFGFKEFKLHHFETITRVNFTVTLCHLFRKNETQRVNPSINKSSITGFYCLNPNPPEKKWYKNVQMMQCGVCLASNLHIRRRRLSLVTGGSVSQSKGHSLTQSLFLRMQYSCNASCLFAVCAMNIYEIFQLQVLVLLFF